MKVYDIVQIVDGAHRGSHKPGRWLVDHRDRREDAENLAERCNKCRFVETLSYIVEEHEELSPERAMPEGTQA